MSDKSTAVKTAPLIQLSNKLSRSLAYESELMGKILTIVDGSFQDKEQRDAVKSLMKNAIYEYYKHSNSSINYLINKFSNVFEDEKIEYTSFEDIHGEHNCRKDGFVVMNEPFIKHESN